VLFDLVRTADVFVDGFAGDALDRLGVGYSALREVRPDLVYCQHSGFGSTGPYAAIPTHGQMMNALAAAIALGIDDDGRATIVETTELMRGTTSGGEGTAVGAVHAAFHVAAALVRRARTGAGCFLDASAADAVVAAGWVGATYGLNQHRLTDRRGLRDPSEKPFTGAKYQFYRTTDGNFVLFCAIEPKFWRRFCEVVERPDLADHHEDEGPVDFSHHDTWLRDELQAVFLTRTQAEWVALAAEQRLPIGPAHQGVPSLRDDAHLRSRQIVVEGEHPVAGPFTYVGEPVVVDGQPYEVRRHAPALGEHTDEVLAELGYDEARIARLRADGIV
jgi:crotonobetainyl-CoA:carnitine CoA-transferase CaiB-like acyl-CoA transferase